MIRLADINDSEQIKRLWNEAFGDSFDEIEKFLNLYINNILLYVEDRFVKGMLSLLPLHRGSIQGSYIYAVATETKSRNRGICSKLIRYAVQYASENRSSFVLLVPAEKSLYKFYKKFGFTEICAVNHKEYTETGFSDVSLDVKKISPERLFFLRKKFFSARNFIEWDIPELEYMWKIYNGNFFEIKGKNTHAFAVCSAVGGMLDFKELCCNNENTEECIAAVNSFFNAPHCRAALPDNSVPSAMIYPPDFKNSYFNLAID